MIPCSKRAQITIFILTGIFFMAAIGFGIYYVTQNMDFTDEVFNQVSKTPSQIRPVHSFVLGCLDSTAEQGIRTLAKNGGYLDPLDHLEVAARPTQSQIIKRGPNKLPYWYHYDDASQQFLHHYPPLRKSEGLNSIEAQLEGYVEDNIGRCLDGFRSFSSRFYVQAEDPSITTTVTKESVVFELDMPMQVLAYTDESTFTLDAFMFDAPVRLEKMYHLAKDIAHTQSMSGFLERPVLELLSLHSGVDRPLPPFYEVELFTPGAGSLWTRDAVVGFIRERILPRISDLQIMYTRNFDYTTAPQTGMTAPSIEEISMQDIIEPTEESYVDLDVYFSYPSKLPPYINIDDDDPVLRSDGASADFAGIFSQMLGAAVRRYRFNYDISYPVVSRVCDTSSFSRRGLCLYFAMEGNIRFNEKFIPSTPADSGFFGGVSGNTVVEFDDPEQYVDKIVQFEVRDKMSGEPLPGADVYYSCGEEYYIDMIELSNGIAEFSGTMPYCAAGGKIILRKDGYFTAARSWNNREDDDSVRLASFELYEKVDVPFSVTKKQPGFYYATYEGIEEGDSILVQITKYKENANEDAFPLRSIFMVGDTSSMYESFSGNMLSMLRSSVDEFDPSSAGYSVEQLLEADAETSSSDTSALDQENILELVPGEYRVTLTYMKTGDPALHIPAEKKRVCLNGDVGPGGFCLGEMDEYMLDEINMPVWVVSEIELDWIVTEDIYTTEEVTFFVPDYPLPQNYDDLEDYESDQEDPDNYEPRVT